jgi:hypothetical protein
MRRLLWLQDILAIAPLDFLLELLRGQHGVPKVISHLESAVDNRASTECSFQPHKMAGNISIKYPKENVDLHIWRRS